MRNIRDWSVREGYRAQALHSDWPIKLPPNPELDYSGRVAMRIAVEDEVYGFFTVCDKARALGQQDYALIREASIAAARILAKRRDAQRESFQLRSELLEDIIHGRVSDTASLRVEAEGLGWDTSGTQQAVVVTIDKTSSLRMLEGAHSHRRGHSPQSRKRIAEIVRLEAAAIDPDSVFAAHHTEMVVLLKLGGRNDTECRECAMGLAERIVGRVPAFLPGVTVSVGVGRHVIGFDHVTDSFRQAQLAAHLAASALGANRAVHYDDLGIYRLLHSIRQQEHIVPDPLRRLMDHDLNHRTQYVQTLRAYFASMGRLTPAANSLGIHRRTLEYRMSRVRGITGVDPDDPEQRLALELGIKLLELGGMESVDG
jgi:purine catabolism regulator